MNAVKGTFKNGQIVLDSTAHWPEGTKVRVRPVDRDDALGVNEDDWEDTPEAIAEWLLWYDSLEPLIFTPEEEAEIAAWRKKVKDYTIANMHQRIDGLFP